MYWIDWQYYSKGRQTSKNKVCSRYFEALGDKLVMSQDALSAWMALLKEATAEKFAEFLKKSVKEMEQALQKKRKDKKKLKSKWN